LVKKSAATALNTVLTSAQPKRPSTEPHGATRQQQAIAKTTAKRSANQIPSVIVVYVIRQVLGTNPGRDTGLSEHVLFVVSPVSSNDGEYPDYSKCSPTVHS
jgi:hypothetical protein